MFWNLFRKKPAPKPEPEKKDSEPQPMRVDDFCKYREGFFTRKLQKPFDPNMVKAINYPRAKDP